MDCVHSDMFLLQQTKNLSSSSFFSRKNPIHFQECSHPGDTDYEEEDEETGEADRPECPYGSDCYRSVITISVTKGSERKV